MQGLQVRDGLLEAFPEILGVRLGRIGPLRGLDAIAFQVAHLAGLQAVRLDAGRGGEAQDRCQRAADDPWAERAGEFRKKPAHYEVVPEDAVARAPTMSLVTVGPTHAAMYAAK